MAEQLVFDLPQRAAMGRAAFLVADSNREAVAVIDGFADWQQPVLNYARHQSQKILLLSEQGAGQLPVGLPDLASRLKAIAAIALKSPDDSLMRGLLLKLFGDRQLKIEPRVVDYLLPRIERDYANIVALVGRIDGQALAEKRAITVPMVAEILESHISDTE